MFHRNPLFQALIALFAVVQSLTAADLQVSIDALHSDDYDARRAALSSLESTIAHASAVEADAAERSALESALLESITDARTPELTRFYVMRLLPPIASEASVNAMLKLVLADGTAESLRNEASGVLAQIHGSATTEAMVDALERASAPARAALLSALAVRRDASHAGKLVELLKAKQLPLDANMMHALGNLPHPEVRAFLFDSWQDAQGAAKADLATALLHTGLARSRELQAVAVETDEPSLKVAAFSQWLGLDETAALPLLQTALAARTVDADALLDQALKVGREATWTWVMERASSLPDSALLVVLGAIGEQERSAHEAWVLQQLEHAHEDVQLAAVQALAKVGTAASTDALIARTRSTSDTLSAAAMNSLAVVQDPDLDARVLSAAAHLDDPDHLRAIDLLSIRNSDGAVELLNGLVAEKALSPATWEVVLQALERVGDLDSVKLLLLKTINEPDTAQVRNLQISLKRLVIRLEQPDRLWDNVFFPVLALALPPALEARVLAILDGISTPAALEYCIAHHRGNDTLLARAAEQALIRWRRVDVSDYWVELLQQAEQGSAQHRMAVRSLGMNLKSTTLANNPPEIARKAAALFLVCSDPDAREQLLQAVATLEGWHQRSFYRALEPALSLQDYREQLAPFAP